MASPYRPARWTPGLQGQFLAFFLLTTAVILALGCWLFYQQSSAFSLNQFRERLREEISLISAAVDGDALESVRTMDDGAYQKVHQQLRRLQASHGNINDVYTMKPIGGDPRSTRWQFMVDAAKPDSPIFSALGAPYEVKDPALLDGWERPSVSRDLYTDEYGTWLTAYAPVQSAQGVRSLIAMDINAKGFQQSQMSLRDVILQMYLIGMLLAAIAAFVIARRLTRPILDLQQVGEQLAQGNLDQHLSVTITQRNDEMGSLARSFEKTLAYLREVGAIAGLMSEGNLSRDISPKSDVDRFGHAIARMIANLRALVRRVRQMAHAVQESASTISDTSRALVAGTDRQSQAVERVAGSMERIVLDADRVDASVQQLSAQAGGMGTGVQRLGAAITETHTAITALAEAIQGVGRNVSDADQATARVRVVAEDGARSVGEAVAGLDDTARIVTELAATIRQLASASAEIGTIVEAIEDIAEQTNLLALNAAIEAARAGEHGRGFAVVADEVRKLAGRASNATRDIQQRIGAIQTETDKAVHVTQAGVESITAGARTAGQAGEALQRISTSVAEVSSRMQSIATATHEQAQASSRIVAAAEQMESSKQQVDEAVQHMARQIHSVATATARQKTEGNDVFEAMQAIARAVEEMSASTARVSTMAGALLDQANGLHEAVAVFELGTEEAGDPAGRKALAPALRAEGSIMV